MAAQKLYKNRQNGQLAGVLAGFADYMKVDVTFLRLLFAFVVLITGIFPGVVFYFIAAVIMPDKPESEKKTDGKE